MKVCFLPSSYMPDTLGGTEIYVHHLATELAKHEVKVTVAYHSSNGEKLAGPLDYEIEILPPLPRPTRLQMYKTTLGREPEGFRELLNRLRPDLLHFHSFTLAAGLDHANLAREYGIPYVITYHVPAMSCPRGTLLRWGEMFCDGNLDRDPCERCLSHKLGWPRPLADLAGLSPFRAEWLPDGPWTTAFAMPSLFRAWRESWREFVGNSAHIVNCAEWCQSVLTRNMVPSEKMFVQRQALPGSERVRRLRLPLPRGRRLRLGTVGRITRVKSPEMVFQAAQGLNNLGIGAECEVVGPIHPSERRWAEGVIANYGVHGKYLGAKQGEDLVNWVRSIDLMVLPGQWMETGPLTLLEAWDQCVPVVGVDAGGIREYMESNGQVELLFQPEDIVGMIEAILRARNWSVGKASAVTVLGQDLLGRAMLALYREILERRGAEAGEDVAMASGFS